MASNEERLWVPLSRVELVLKWQKYMENHMGHTGTGPIGSSNAPPSIGGLMLELQPTFVSVDMELIRKSLAIAEDAKEFAQELLTRHDDELGRTTKKNKMWADQLEKSIAQTVSGISDLRKALGITV